jgi:arylsulfatase A-like enzyme
MPDWDLHDNIAALVKPRCEKLDRSVSALVQDLGERGMLDHVLVVVMGEFGRTPKLNTSGVPGQTGIPGRDHWGNAISVLMAGGGLRMGQVVGATNPNGEYPVESPYRPEDVLATIYRVLGIDPRTEFLDRQGRPIPMLPSGDPIKELV